jgi:hypothetical protein
VFLHLVGSVGHILHTHATRAQNVDTLFFMFMGARCGFPKKCVGTRYVELVFLHPVGSVDLVVHSSVFRGMKHQHTIFHAWVGLV